MFGELMDNIKLEVLNNLFRSTTNLQAFENLLRSLPQSLIQADVPGLSRPQQAAPPPPASDTEPEAPKIELPIKRELRRSAATAVPVRQRHSKISAAERRDEW